MPDLMVFVAIVALLAAGLIAVALRTFGRGKELEEELSPSLSLPITTETPRDTPEVLDASESAAPVVQRAEVMVLPTEVANEFFMFGHADDLDGLGTTRASVPSQLSRHAVGLRGAVDAVKTYGEMSGRLVLVDDKTASAIKTGRMLHDKSGEILAIVQGADKKFESVARLRQVGTLVGGAASLTNALSAMAMQAQLERIEKQLASISASVDKVNQELLREWHAETRGAQDMLREVYGTATHVGELSPENWAQIAALGQLVRKQIHGDRSRFEEDVRELEIDLSAKSVKVRSEKLEEDVEALRRDHALLTESTRTWIQFSALRLWRFTVSQDSTLPEYRLELQKFLADSQRHMEPLRSRAVKAIEDADARISRLAKIRHPFLSHRLPEAKVAQLQLLSEVNWRPLELAPPSRELALRTPSPEQPEGMRRDSTGEPARRM